MGYTYLIGAKTRLTKFLKEEKTNFFKNEQANKPIFALHFKPNLIENVKHGGEWRDKRAPIL